MTIVFFILVALACIVLGLLVLIQNPKGGGLSGTFGGINNQFMGVKQTTDVLEKGTWLFSAIIAILCITSVLFFSKVATTNDNGILNNLPTTAPANKQAPATSPLVAPPAADTNKK